MVGNILKSEINPHLLQSAGKHCLAQEEKAPNYSYAETARLPLLVVFQRTCSL